MCPPLYREVLSSQTEKIEAQGNTPKSLEDCEAHLFKKLEFTYPLLRKQAAAIQTYRDTFKNATCDKLDKGASRETCWIMDDLRWDTLKSPHPHDWQFDIVPLP